MTYGVRDLESAKALQPSPMADAAGSPLGDPGSSIRRPHGDCRDLRFQWKLAGGRSVRTTCDVSRNDVAGIDPQNADGSSANCIDEALGLGTTGLPSPARGGSVARKRPSGPAIHTE